MKVQPTVTRRTPHLHLTTMRQERTLGASRLHARALPVTGKPGTTCQSLLPRVESLCLSVDMLPQKERLVGSSFHR